MNKHLSSEKGLTLVELLAVLVIGTIIFLLISNIHLFSQK
ncbi:MAG: prepilin-type N-terminal cleavage/methylation domain-containing protein, partial [Sporosarcina sp.]